MFVHKRKAAIILLIFLFGSLAPGNYCMEEVSKYDFQEGDILLQHGASSLNSVIADVSNSQYSHCGIIAKKDGNIYVIEAANSVIYTPVKRWLNRGADRKFTQVRPKNLSKDQIKKVIKEADKFLGRAYDIQYEMADDRIYCSELVYKAFLNGCNIEVGKKETLGSLKWRPHEDFIRSITGGKLPLDRVMVTPESLTRNPNLELIYSTFPQRIVEPLYETDILEGNWRGEYTIMGLTKAIASLEFGKEGTFRSGIIKKSDETIIKINSVSISPFKETRNFKAAVMDARNIKADLNVQVRDNGNRLIGTWKDDQGYNGLFSLEKVKIEK